ncbi:Twin-arginine translocation protein TatB [Rhodovulum sp. PH10]|uniref:Sec-independent protein translocase protein TatB n=1 Tax=Rhodovulum sp. PH10 TaxID=1187851 RepID=UPI00027C28ED|nr:Sec-independent protein translocase protein TatB [Rhodovulum sp. PH10]EJW12197.1 Twin-arginine translocation protein TatB [Rhodovulum sp. PH10]
MFDIGWSELLVVGVVALIAIGPKELPGVLRMVGQWYGKLRRMGAEFQGQFQEALREAEMADLKKQVDELSDAARSIGRYDPLAETNSSRATPVKVTPELVAGPGSEAAAAAAAAATAGAAAKTEALTAIGDAAKDEPEGIGAGTPAATGAPETPPVPPMTPASGEPAPVSPTTPADTAASAALPLETPALETPAAEASVSGADGADKSAAKEESAERPA